MSNANLTLRARQCLYSLKRTYGGRIDIYKLGSTSTDVRTGVKTISKTLYSIDRAAVMPMKVDRTTQQSISLISSNKEFVSGGTSDIGSRDFIIDRRDCPGLPELGADDWIVFNNQKYQIKSVETLEFDAGWIITAKKLAGEVPEQIYARHPDHILAFSQAATAEVG